MTWFDSIAYPVFIWCAGAYGQWLALYYFRSTAIPPGTEVDKSASFKTCALTGAVLAFIWIANHWNH